MRLPLCVAVCLALEACCSSSGSRSTGGATAGGTTSATGGGPTNPVNQTVFAGGAPSSAPGLFQGTPQASSQSSPQFIYPYDQVVLPVNLQPLDFQWKPGAGNTLYQIVLSGPGGTLTGYVIPPTPSQPAWQPDPSVWAAFAQANVGQVVSLSLSGTAGGPGDAVYGATVQHLTLAASRFAGTIYYWTVSGPGQVLRVDASGTPDVFYAPPTQPGGTSNCMGCHSVSRDGTQLSAELWASQAPNSGTVLDLSQSPVTATVPGGTDVWDFSTFDNTGTLLTTAFTGALTLRDSQTGAPVPAGAGPLGSIGCGSGSRCTHPAWTADGTRLLYALGVQGHFNYDVDFDQSDLMSAPWSPSTQTFGAPATLLAHDYDGHQLANFHPTPSIDSTLVAFNRGPCSRSDGTTACPSTCPQSACGVTGNVPPSNLMLMALDGGTPVELVNAEGPDVRNWFPNFSPFKEGGYHWLAFFSLRDYGWVTAGTNTRQLWVTAIDADGNPSSDVSHPAFWLPGQEATTDNDKAEWAPLPCVGSGQTCQGDIDCCGGLVCRDTSNEIGGSVCVAQTGACGYAGDSCAQDSDCCSPFTCQSGQCGVGFK